MCSPIPGIPAVFVVNYKPNVHISSKLNVRRKRTTIKTSYLKYPEVPAKRSSDKPSFINFHSSSNLTLNYQVPHTNICVLVLNFLIEWVVFPSPSEKKVLLFCIHRPVVCFSYCNVGTWRGLMQLHPVQFITLFNSPFHLVFVYYWIHYGI